MSSLRRATQQTAKKRLVFAILRGLVLILLSAGYLVPSLHFAIVEHELCAEHGQLHHAEDPALSDSSFAAAPASKAAPSVEREHDHDHCGAFTTVSSRATSAGRSTLGFELSFQIAVAPPLDADAAHRSLELLSYAPKLAPPS